MSETTAEPLAPSADATPTPSIDDTLSAAFDRVNAPEEAADEVEAAAPEPAGETQEETPPPENQQRGPDGKFVAAEKPVDAAAPSVAPALPDYIAPFQEDFAQRGLAPDTAIPRLLTTWRHLEQNPEATLEWLAGQYGLKAQFWRMGAQRQQGGQQQTEPQQQDLQPEWAADPAYAALRKELDDLKAQAAIRDQEFQRQQEAAVARAYTAVNDEVANFAKSKASEGIPFDFIRPHMADAIATGKASTLEEAYRLAADDFRRHATPLLERERTQAQEAQRKAAEAARRANGINVRSDVATPGRPRTVDESLERAFDAAQAR